MEYKLGNFIFQTEEEFLQAKRELAWIKMVKDKFDINDLDVLKEIRVKFKPKTSIGLQFLSGVEKKIALLSAEDNKAEEVPIKSVQSEETAQQKEDSTPLRTEETPIDVDDRPNHDRVFRTVDNIICIQAPNINDVKKNFLSPEQINEKKWGSYLIIAASIISLFFSYSLYKNAFIISRSSAHTIPKSISTSEPLEEPATENEDPYSLEFENNPSIGIIPSNEDEKSIQDDEDIEFLTDPSTDHLPDWVAKSYYTWSYIEEKFKYEGAGGVFFGEIQPYPKEGYSQLIVDGHSIIFNDIPDHEIRYGTVVILVYTIENYEPVGNGYIVKTDELVYLDKDYNIVENVHSDGRTVKQKASEPKDGSGTKQEEPVIGRRIVTSDGTLCYAIPMDCDGNNVLYDDGDVCIKNMQYNGVREVAQYYYVNYSGTMEYSGKKELQSVSVKMSFLDKDDELCSSWDSGFALIMIQTPEYPTGQIKTGDIIDFDIDIITDKYGLDNARQLAITAETATPQIP